MKRAIMLLCLVFGYTTSAVGEHHHEPWLKDILKSITRYRHNEINDTLGALRKALNAHNVDTFIACMKQFYAHIPYTIAIEKEKYYQTIFYVVLRLINANPEVERATNVGRIDMVVEVDDCIYIFEFKLNGSAKAALQQIHEMHYYQPYLSMGKKILLVGINFSSKERNIADYLFEEFCSTKMIMS